MTQQEYLKIRVEDQIDWYDKKSAISKKYHLFTKIAVIVMAALIPFTAGFVDEGGKLVTTLIGILGVSTSILSGLSALYKYHEKWNEYRTTTETLKHEKHLFLTASGPYDIDNDTERFKLLVNRIENLISKQNSAWSQYINNKD